MIYHYEKCIALSQDEYIIKNWRNVCIIFCIINLKIFSYLHGLVLQLFMLHKRNLKAFFCSLLIYLQVIYDLQNSFLICQKNKKLYFDTFFVEAIFCEH